MQKVEAHPVEERGKGIGEEGLAAANDGLLQEREIAKARPHRPADAESGGHQIPQAREAGEVRQPLLERVGQRKQDPHCPWPPWNPRDWLVGDMKQDPPHTWNGGGRSAGEKHTENVYTL